MKQTKDKSSIKTESITIKLSKEEFDFVKSNSQKINISISEYIRARLLWYIFHAKSHHEEMSIRKSGLRKGERYYYQQKYTGVVKEHPVEISQSIENEYRQNISNGQRVTFSNRNNSPVNTSPVNPTITLTPSQLYQNEVDEQQDIRQHNINYLTDLIQKGDLHMGDRFYREKEGTGKIIHRYLTVGPIVNDLTYFDRFTK
jgi:hypothetical protein